jgi:hypothetical protein
MRLTTSVAIIFTLSSCGVWTRILLSRGLLSTLVELPHISSLLRLLLLYHHLLTLNNSVGALRSRRSCVPIVGFAFRPLHVKQLYAKRLGYCYRVNCPMHQFPTKGCAEEYTEGNMPHSRRCFDLKLPDRFPLAEALVPEVWGWRHSITYPDADYKQAFDDIASLYLSTLSADRDPASVSMKE